MRMLVFSLALLALAGCHREPPPMREGESSAAPAPDTSSSASTVAPAASNATPAPEADAEPAVDPGFPTAVHPFPAGLTGELLFQSDRDGATRAYILDLATGKVRRVGPAGDWFDEEPQWSPDGTRIVMASTRGQKDNIDIYVMNPDGSNVIRLTDHPAKDQGPTWAPDGQSIFFTSERDGRGEIYRVWLADKRVERLTKGFDRAIMPAVSPDGKYLAYAGQTIMYFQIFLRDLEKGTTQQITSGGGACNPSFSPDGKELAFVRLDSEPSRLETIRETGLRVALADQKLWSYYPDYSNDGRHLAFSVSPEHHRGEDWDLVYAPLDGSNRFVRLTVGPGNDRSPDWRPQR